MLQCLCFKKNVCIFDNYWFCNVNSVLIDKIKFADLNVFFGINFVENDAALPQPVPSSSSDRCAAPVHVQQLQKLMDIKPFLVQLEKWMSSSIK